MWAEAQVELSGCYNLGSGAWKLKQGIHAAEAFLCETSVFVLKILNWMAYYVLSGDLIFIKSTNFNAIKFQKYSHSNICISVKTKS